MRKEPITVETLDALVEKLGAIPSLADVRLATGVLLAFTAFLHYDELANLHCCDVTFAGDSMSVQITSSKTDQYREGATVLVAQTHSPIYFPSGHDGKVLLHGGTAPGIYVACIPRYSACQSG